SRAQKFRLELHGYGGQFRWQLRQKRRRQGRIEHRGDEAALHRTVSVGEFRLRAKTEMHRAVRIDRKKLAAEQLCDRGDQVEIGSAHLPLRSSTSVVPSAA